MGGIFSCVRDLARWVAGFAGRLPASAQAGRGGRSPAQPGRPPGDAARPGGDHGSTASGTVAQFGEPSLDQLRLRPVRRGRSRLRHDRPAQRRLSRLRQPDALASGNRARHRGAGQQHVCARGRARGRVAVGAADGASPAGQGTGSCPPCAVPLPGGQPWPETLAARDTVNGLLADWNDDVAARIFAPNIELDRPLAQRQADDRELRERIGAFAADPGRPAECESPAHCRWWLTGPAGTVDGADQAGAAAAAARAAAGHRRAARAWLRSACGAGPARRRGQRRRADLAGGSDQLRTASTLTAQCGSCASRPPGRAGARSTVTWPGTAARQRDGAAGRSDRDGRARGGDQRVRVSVQRRADVALLG